MIADVKGAFLMSKQPTGEKYYRLDRCLAGQRTAAKQWFELFNATVKAMGGVADDATNTTQVERSADKRPCGRSVFAWSKTAMDNFIDYLKTKAGWKMDIEGPFKNIDEFMYLKRKYSITRDGNT